ncbi:MAG TPA: hypothetical protein VEH84_09490, partial [Alphaproteobacteria bacterium]|nr:hypothetical protein [Alphaproteobacteria bacterium]
RAQLESNRSSIDSYLDRAPTSACCVILDSVHGSTFRAYRTLNKTPSSIYRSWAYSWMVEREPDFVSRLGMANTKEKFDEFHCALGDDLRQYWFQQEGTEFSWGHSRKLLDLFLKHVLFWDKLDRGSPARNNLRKFAKPALDKFTLKYISAVSGIAGLRNKSSWTMGYINNSIERYTAVQNAILAAVEEEPIRFDVLAWNLEHSKSIGLGSQASKKHDRHNPGSFLIKAKPVN